MLPPARLRRSPGALLSLGVEWNDDIDGDDLNLDFSERRGESTIIWARCSVARTVSREVRKRSIVGSPTVQRGGEVKIGIGRCLLFWTPWGLGLRGVAGVGVGRGLREERVWVRDRDPATRAPPGCSLAPVVARLLGLLSESLSSPSSYSTETWSTSVCGRGLGAVAGDVVAAESRWKRDEWPKKPFDMYPEHCLRLLQTSTSCLPGALLSPHERILYCSGRLY